MLPDSEPLSCASFAGVFAAVERGAAERGVVPLHNSGVRRCLFPVLSVGGSIVCTPGLTGHSFIDWLDEFKPTFYIGVPALQRAVLDEVARRGRAAGSSLRFILSGGAAFRRLETSTYRRGCRCPI